jgi:hypothetical protein
LPCLHRQYEPAASEKSYSQFSIHQKAHHFFESVLGWYDILSCASTGLSPLSERPLFSDLNIHVDLGLLRACDNSVTAIIWEIATLSSERVPSDDTRYAQLSSIEGSVTAVLLEFERGRQKSHQVVSARYMIKQIFAWAAHVYLNVVAYDPYTRQSEIQEGVSKAIEGFEEVLSCYPSVLGMLAWPLCVIGSMATSKQRHFFEQLSAMICDTKAAITKFQTLQRCYLIIQETWRLKERAGDARKGMQITWMDAMKSLDMVILLA